MSSAEPSVTMRSWFVWFAGAGVYLLAVFNRSTLGVAGPDAMIKFGIGPGQLSVFVLLQVGVYAVMQIPAGLLVDRFGPRKVLLAAALTMGIGQLTFAFVPSYGLALLARGVLGCGDALTYVSVLRLLTSWFPGERYAMLASLSGFFGMVGNVLATVPLAMLLPVAGWGPSFATAAIICLVYALILVRPGTVTPPYLQLPLEQDPPTRTKNFDLRAMLRDVRDAATLTGGRLSFWVHFTTMSGSATFLLLWGFPYLTEALGYDRALASALLMLMVVVQLGLAVVFGWFMGSRPDLRMPLVIVTCLLNLLVWVTFTAWPDGRPPFPVVIAAIAVMASGGPASAVAFMLARDYQPRQRLSTGTGYANAGGWTATALCSVAVGVVLDLAGARTGVAESYRWAFGTIALITALALGRLLVWWLRSRRELLALQASGGQGPVVVRRHRFDLPHSEHH
ncbi:MFS transporter [Naumannella halotolerans]|uniref:MFS transporter n=1 Tax=Naumannella halotolerans TaxID=993414 RepID=UPI00370D3622